MGQWIQCCEAAGQLRPLRHHIYRGAVVGVRGATVEARGAVVGVRGAAVGNIGMHTYILDEEHNIVVYESHITD